MKNEDTRLSDLERATGSDKVQKIIYARDDLPGEYTERSPFSKDPGEHWTEDQKQALAAEFDLQIIEYTRDWRGQAG